MIEINSRLHKGSTLEADGREEQMRSGEPQFHLGTDEVDYPPSMHYGKNIEIFNSWGYYHSFILLQQTHLDVSIVFISSMVIEVTLIILSSSLALIIQ